MSARVLVVDDDRGVRAAMERMLTTAGYQVSSACDGEEALRRIQCEAVDVVVTDLVMPKADGMVLLQTLHERASELPVVLVAGAPTTESAIHAVRYRAVEYLTKPFTPVALVEAVARAVQLSTTARRHREAFERSSANEHDAEQSALDLNFSRALDALYMVYQPIVSWSRKAPFGYEALVRSSERSLPHPGALFEAAERLSRISELGRHIRARCGAPLATHDTEFTLFVNLHSRDLLDESLYDEAAPLAPWAQRTVLEITERAALDGIKDITSRIAQLRSLGYRIAVDDIGAGYSGLNSLATVQPDFVKLDITLVRGLDKDPVRQRLVRLLSELCRDLNIYVVAEGVETPSERDSLIGLGLDLLQGYLFARPAAPFVTPQF